MDEGAVVGMMGMCLSLQCDVGEGCKVAGCVVCCKGWLSA